MDAEGCPRCSGTCHWGLSNGKRLCATCRYDWRPGRLPLYLTKRLGRQMLHWFPRGLSAGRVARVAPRPNAQGADSIAGFRRG